MTPPLRVLVVDQARGVWGAQRYLLRLAPLLRERGVELTLAGPRSLELHAVWTASGFDALHVDLPIERSIRDVSGRPSPAAIMREVCGSLTAARRIAHLARHGGYDVIWSNAHWIHLEAGVAGRIARRPVVLHLHEESVPGLGQWLRAGVVGMASRTIAVSKAVADGLPPRVSKRVCVIPNGVDTRALSPSDDVDPSVHTLRAEFGIGADDVMVLAATRLDPVKRIEDLIATIEALDDPRIRLVVAGATSGFADYERSVRRAAGELAAGRVQFCGNREDMVALFRASDVLLHTGIVEGMPLGLIEAQSCGKPVVAYDVAGVPEVIMQGETGLLAAPYDVAGLADALRTLVRNPALRHEMGAAGRRRVVKYHRVEAQADRNVEVLAAMRGSNAKAGAI